MKYKRISGFWFEKIETGEKVMMLINTGCIFDDTLGEVVEDKAYWANYKAKREEIKKVRLEIASYIESKSKSGNEG